ncbi:related to FK506 suppressor Sfk1 [Rhynchosporium graminicola]|uniref:Related to FK506 suppressor Sfk1 n=1 Tax=Rhynchosporium graminicola TaxID=2792576 RepID=A0A1E1KWJ7_9HELO|nr:related to FK506 suppressor Sfk1 [Rhynchosporium commune]
MWGVSYWVFPVISGLTWLGMLLGLLLHWTTTGKPIYPSMDSTQHIAYISDVGAQSLKPLFIAGSCVTTIFLDLSFLSERWLRHRGRLARNQTTTEKVLSWLSMFFALVGTAGLILLSIFDTLRHPSLHDVFLVLFIGGYVLSSVFICWEYQRLGIQYREHSILRTSFWIKLVFILIEVALAIAFGTCNVKDKFDIAAVLEWTIAFVFTFYVFSFYIDLLPAVKTRHESARFGTGQGETEMQMEQNDHFAQQEPGGGYYGDAGRGARYTAESQRTVGRNDVRTVNGTKFDNGTAPVASNF